MTKTTRRQTLQILGAGAFAGLAPGLFSTTTLAATHSHCMVVKALASASLVPAGMRLERQRNSAIAN
jgi:hypothetical protein